MDKDFDKDWLVNTLDRTSVTVDEAVVILLGWADGPTIDHPRSDNPPNPEQDDPLTTSLDYLLRGMGATYILEYKDAMRRRLPDHVIAEKRATMKKFPDEVTQANDYLRAINDELNEGDSSVLRIDKDLSTGAVRFITRSSFDRWVQDRFGFSFAALISQRKASPAPQELPLVGVKEATQGTNQQSEARQRLRAQEKAVLDEIKRLGYEPTQLPERLPGKRTVKADVKAALDGTPLFTAKTAFKRTWDQLRSDRSVVEVKKVSPL